MATKLSKYICDETKCAVFKYCPSNVPKHVVCIIIEYYFILQPGNLAYKMDNPLQFTPLNTDTLHTGYITDTLQGSIFMADNVVIKRTSRYLHNRGITIQNGKEYKVNENNIKEYKILSYFNSFRKWNALQITKLIDFFQTECNYYLVMENAGKDLFNFIVRAHELINEKQLRTKEWRKFVKYMFYQIVLVVQWLHNQMNCSHLNIALENLCVQNGSFILQPDGYFTINPKIKLTLIDYGSAEFFDPSDKFRCVKFCGITGYQAPEVYQRKHIFDARKADIWSLGVVLFRMAVGSPPYRKPSDTDICYLNYIKTGQIDTLLFQWNRHWSLSRKMLDLLKHMLEVDSNARYLIQNVLNHPWLLIYQKQYKNLLLPSENEVNRLKTNANVEKITTYKLPTKQ